MSRPCPSQIAVAKSPVFIIAERPVFHTAIAISSVMEASSFFTTSTRMGSNARLMFPPSLLFKLIVHVSRQYSHTHLPQPASLVGPPQSYQIPQQSTGQLAFSPLDQSDAKYEFCVRHFVVRNTHGG